MTYSRARYCAVTKYDMKIEDRIKKFFNRSWWKVIGNGTTEWLWERIQAVDWGNS